MTDDQKDKCHLIIHGAAASAAAVGGGMAQIPLADHLVITPIQIAMIIALGEVFGQHVTDSAAKGVALGMAAQFTGRAVSQVLFGWIPLFGNAINASTAAGLTEAVGWAVVSRLDKGDHL